MTNDRSEKKSNDPMPGVSRFQKFEFVRIHRSQLKDSPYNPRTISPAAKKKLQKVLEVE